MTRPDLDRRGMSARLSDRDWASILDTCSEVVEIPARTLVSRRDEPLDRSLLLVEGLMSRHVPGPYRDRREMVALEVPGDFVDLHSFPTGRLDHDVSTVDDCRLAVFPHSALRKLVHIQPETGIALWSMTVTDSAIHRYWSFRVGALPAMGRMANFIAEMELRLRLAGLAHDGRFSLPLTQSDMGEACGMSAVHINRVLRDLREDGCCSIQSGWIEIHDLERLHRIGHFEPTFLLGEQDYIVGR
ncbi:Crp/Fnr family transcriptional regulator [Roseobacter sp. HKCCA0434]|uniref:Crp/Fnr family transcriptional regulator n=1 Tax=Roseobacter sp. HKCCA0434 TaxID=3079297 RepID=UPI002905F482|nr:Crp/Fnr family transcriptional regulator [Roseobacter sp. HKCCA0434]